MKIGHFFVIGISGKTLSLDEKKFIEEIRPAGIILGRHNYESLGQISELTNSIQQLRDENPFFVCVKIGPASDFFGNEFVNIPDKSSLVALNSPKLVFELNQFIAQQLQALGINVAITDNFLLNENEVSKYSSGMVRGLETQKLASIIRPQLVQESAGVDWGALSKIVKAKCSIVDITGLVNNSLSQISIDQTIASIRDISRFNGPVMMRLFDSYTVANTPMNSTSGSVSHWLKNGVDLIYIPNFTDAQREFEKTMSDYREQKFKMTNLKEKFDRINQLKREKLSKFLPSDPTQIQTLFRGPLVDQMNLKIQEQIGQICRK